MSTRILLIEDSRTQALRMQLELQRYGLEVNVISHGSAGLAAARTYQPAAIILDVNLPGVDGFALCKMLREDSQTAHIPILMMTQRDTARDTLQGVEAGATEYIPKDAYAERNLANALRKLNILQD